MKLTKFKFYPLLFVLAGLVFSACNSKPPSKRAKEDISQLSSDTTQTQGEAAEIKVNQKEPYGSYLTNGNGRSLYMFVKDTKMRARKSGSTCYDECSEAWPPFLAENGDIKAGAQIDTTLLGTTKRKDGTIQVTYNDYPLYYYIDDKKAGDVYGQDKKEYSFKWYLVKPNGDEIEDIDVTGAKEK